VQECENGVIQLFAWLQMTARDTARPRASIVETDRSLGTKPRDPLEDGFGANLKIPGH
jgi:hypothetical protein